MPSYWSQLLPDRRPVHTFEDSGTDADGEPLCARRGCTWAPGFHPHEEELAAYRATRAPAAGE